MFQWVPLFPTVPCRCSLGALVPCQRPHESSSQAWRPLNVVVISFDTLRPDRLHCYGYAKIESPSLDRLAENGVLFENGVSQTPPTPPTYASIFTRLNPPKDKVRGSGGFGLSPSTPSLACLLQQEGWDAAAFISSAVLKKRFGSNHGFNVYDDQLPQPGNAQEFMEDAERPRSIRLFV